MVDPTLAGALIHDEARTSGQRWWRRPIFGRRVRPFSIWHRFVLESIESPILAGGTIFAGDLRRAVSICGELYPVINIGKPHPLDFWRSVGPNFRQHVEAWKEYRADYRSFPDYSIISEHSDAPALPSGGPCPFSIRLVSDIIEWSGWQAADVWTLAEGEAQWWQVMAFRAKGMKLDFLDPETRATQEKIAAEHPEIHAQLEQATAQWREASHA